jgi:hypothetical protein
MSGQSPNPNIFVTPNIQIPQMPPWSAVQVYYYGDCVVGTDGFAYCFLCGFDAVPTNPYPNVGLTADPTLPGNSLSLTNQLGSKYGGDFSSSPTPDNPNGAGWVNLSLLSPRVPPWSSKVSYNAGDLVFYPNDEPTQVWRAYQSNFNVAPNLPQANRVAVVTSSFNPQANGLSPNNVWGLISAPVQVTSFNPQ